MYTGWVGMEVLDGRTLLPSILKATGLTPSLEEGNLSPEERGEVGDIRGGEGRERELQLCVVVHICNRSLWKAEEGRASWV